MAYQLLSYYLKEENPDCLIQDIQGQLRNFFVSSPRRKLQIPFQILMHFFTKLGQLEVHNQPF
jgi:hypothetical protein